MIFFRLDRSADWFTPAVADGCSLIGNPLIWMMVDPEICHLALVIISPMWLPSMSYPVIALPAVHSGGPSFNMLLEGVEVEKWIVELKLPYSF